MNLLCSYVTRDGSECVNDAAFSFLIRDDKSLEICALHFSAAWIKGVFENYGFIHDMAVFSSPQRNSEVGSER